MVPSTAVDPRHSLRTQLDEQRRAIDARLAELGRHIGLTSAEKVEYVQLKKRKLAMKDRLLTLEGS